MYRYWSFNRSLHATIRLGIFAGIIVAAFWWGWSIFAPVPTTHFDALPFSVSRWWDCLFVIPWVAVIVFIVIPFGQEEKRREKCREEFEQPVMSIMVAVISAMMGLSFGLVFGLILLLAWGLIFGLYISLIFLFKSGFFIAHDKD